jgi:1-acyl-sn-glycerol-3-phosphate acyltransferase
MWDRAEDRFAALLGAAVKWVTFGRAKLEPAPLRAPRLREPRAFHRDEEIAQGWVFRAFSAGLCTYADVVHAFSVQGLEKLPRDEPVLFVLPHSTHNMDIFVSLFKMQQLCGRFPRGLFHRGVMLCWGWLLRHFGGVPGKRDIAYELAMEGIHTACIPGGVEDVLHHLTASGRTAYELCWESHNNPGVLRTGFGSVAREIGSGFKIVPMYVENGEEMKCNVLFEIWTALKLDVLYGWTMRQMPGPVHWLMWQVAIFTWCTLSFASIVVPVKVTAHLGDVIAVTKDETAEELAVRTHDALQGLIDKTQGRRHRSYRTGLQHRWDALKLSIAAKLRSVGA